MKIGKKLASQDICQSEKEPEVKPSIFVSTSQEELMSRNTRSGLTDFPASKHLRCNIQQSIFPHAED